MRNTAIGWVILPIYTFENKEGKKYKSKGIFEKKLYNSFHNACEAVYYLTNIDTSVKYTIHKVELSDIETEWCLLKHKTTGELKLNRIYYNWARFNVKEALQYWKEYEIQFITINK